MSVLDGDKLATLIKLLCVFGERILCDTVHRIITMTPIRREPGLTEQDSAYQ